MVLYGLKIRPSYAFANDSAHREPPSRELRLQQSRHQAAMRCSGGLSRVALGTSRVLWGLGPRLAAAPGLRPLSSVCSGTALALPVVLAASPGGAAPVSPCAASSFGLGGPTPPVSGRRPDEAFHVQQHPQTGGGHEHGVC